MRKGENGTGSKAQSIADEKNKNSGNGGHDAGRSASKSWTIEEKDGVSDVRGGTRIWGLKVKGILSPPGCSAIQRTREKRRKRFRGPAGIVRPPSV